MASVSPSVTISRSRAGPRFHARRARLPGVSGFVACGTMVLACTGWRMRASFPPPGRSRGLSSHAVEALPEFLPRLEVSAVHDAPPATAERAEVAGVLPDELPERAAADAEVVHDFFAGQWAAVIHFHSLLSYTRVTPGVH